MKAYILRGRRRPVAVQTRPASGQSGGQMKSALLAKISPRRPRTTFGKRLEIASGTGKTSTPSFSESVARSHSKATCTGADGTIQRPEPEGFRWLLRNPTPSRHTVRNPCSANSRQRGGLFSTIKISADACRRLRTSAACRPNRPPPMIQNIFSAVGFKGCMPQHIQPQETIRPKRYGVIFTAAGTPCQILPHLVMKSCETA